MITVLAGGVGAARFLRGLIRVVDPSTVSVISNTGDDFHVYGAHVSPDLDIVTYTLAGLVDEARGFGLEGDTFTVMDGIRAFGVDTWFTLGDRDFTTCLARAAFCAAGGTPTEFAERLTHLHGLEIRMLPMTDDPVATIVRVRLGTQERDLHFQEYWVRRKAADPVVSVRLDGAEHARPAPGILEAIESASVIVVAPSNPVVSIGTILAVPGIRKAILNAAAPVVGVCPIIGGAPVRGMADRLMPAAGVPVSCAGVAGLYEGLLDGFVIDLVDAEESGRVADAGGGIQVEAAQTMMHTSEDAAALAKSALTLAERLA